ncbi:sll0787 family AIR synthase-like protein [Pelomonas cellulosilytica]|uniref:Sll0787 family AIR synthase-like protein n=1 Tax=Pelomonas cellulosilytica TaxID=2906762 RepID=A0ABS8XXK1_9BURK|nr:sll0787 family AIR synthase-like protein [Pelomonas sp. P8]MCE4555336.1 sll0787 family AIR synthase-like protein [Pelomonas sp. P8]
MSHLEQLALGLRTGRGFRHKRDIASVLPRIAPGATTVPNGDDCAVLPDGHGGHLLFAIEGLMQDFVKAMPWFAGYSGVMVNLSDIAAMGGRALAVVDALWAAEEDTAGQLVAGMRDACERYGVPLVGGHTNLQSRSGQLAVAVMGRANRLISSFAAREGDRLLMAVDLRGTWQADRPFWNASTDAPPQRLRDDLALLPLLAEAGLCDAGKDISMAGVLGTLLMLLECSGVGARVDLAKLPRPHAAPSWLDDSGDAIASQLRWLSAFPSYGFVLSVREANAQAVMRRFEARGIACADIGTVVPGTRLDVQLGAECTPLWDLAEQPFIGAGAAPAPLGHAA